MVRIDPREVKRPTMAEVLEMNRGDAEYQEMALKEAGYGYVGDIKIMIENKRDLARFHHDTADDCEAHGDALGRNNWREQAISEWKEANQLAVWIGEDEVA